MPNGRRRARVLMVDDEPDLLRMVEMWLSRHCEFEVLDDGERLLEVLQARRPDALMLDLHMPGPDGLELCRALREHPEFKTLPVLLLTGSSVSDEFMRSFGANSYLVKPVGRQQLLAALRELLPQPEFSL